jgi:hypothetical protein
MAATVQLNEYNGAGATKTSNVANGHFLWADLPGDSDRRTANPITKPPSGTNYSYEKYQKLEIGAMGGSTQLDTFRHYLTATLDTGFSQYTSAANPPVQPTYAQPVNTVSSKATTAMPTSDPGAARIYGTLTAVGQETGYVVTQLRVADTAAAGYDRTTQWRYAEIS